MSQSFTYDAAGYPNFPGSRKCDRVFSPDELNALQDIFDECLKECGFSRDCEAAEALGSSLIRLYSQGMRDPTIIRSMILTSFKDQ